MRPLPQLILPLFLLLAGSAQAAVYKCLQQGKTTYTDRPCDAAAQPATLPPLNTVQQSASDDLVKGYDERLKRDSAARDADRAAQSKNYGEITERDKAIRAAIIDHRAIKGMTASQLDSALGNADQTLDNGTRRYLLNGRRSTITFKEGLVSGISTTTTERPRK